VAARRILADFGVQNAPTAAGWYHRRFLSAWQIGWIGLVIERAFVLPRTRSASARIS
jgi:hypothetical protein